jgi:hypothetical protein
LLMHVISTLGPAPTCTISSLRQTTLQFLHSQIPILLHLLLLLFFAPSRRLRPFGLLCFNHLRSFSFLYLALSTAAAHFRCSTRYTACAPTKYTMIVMEGMMLVPPERGTIIGRALWKVGRHGFGVLCLRQRAYLTIEYSLDTSSLVPGPC